MWKENASGNTDLQNLGEGIYSCGQIQLSSCWVRVISPLILERKIACHPTFGILEVCFCRENHIEMEEHLLLSFTLSFFLPLSNFLGPFNSQAPNPLKAGLQVRRKQQEQMDSSEFQSLVSTPIEPDDTEQGVKLCWQRAWELLAGNFPRLWWFLTRWQPNGAAFCSEGIWCFKHSLSPRAKQKEVPPGPCGMQMRRCYPHVVLGSPAPKEQEDDTTICM